MLKLLVGLIGLVEALYPDRFMRVVTDLSYEFDGEPPTPKPWIVTAARIEGLVLLGVVIRAAITADRATRRAEQPTDAADAESDTDTDADSDESVDTSGTVDRI